MPNYGWISMLFPSPLVFRYHLPLPCNLFGYILQTLSRIVLYKQDKAHGLPKWKVWEYLVEVFLKPWLYKGSTVRCSSLFPSSMFAESHLSTNKHCVPNPTLHIEEVQVKFFLKTCNKYWRKYTISLPITSWANASKMQLLEPNKRQ